MSRPATTLVLVVAVLASTGRLNGQSSGSRICALQPGHPRSSPERIELVDDHLAECLWSGLPACWVSARCEEVAQKPRQRRQEHLILTGDACDRAQELFALKRQDLPVFKVNRSVLFSAGMTIDADGAPNAYGPKNRGLDFTANARNANGWAALVTNAKGRPVLQRTGPYRGYYVSTTSLEQPNVRDPRDPRKYMDARRIPYIALPADFAHRFGISLGDLALVVNTQSGRSAYAIYADVGPRGRIGEGSIALANKLKIPSNPRHDSVPDGVTYLIFPGSGASAKKPITPGGIDISAARLYRRWSKEKGCAIVTSVH